MATEVGTLSGLVRLDVADLQANLLRAEFAGLGELAPMALAVVGKLEGAKPFRRGGARGFAASRAEFGRWEVVSVESPEGLLINVEWICDRDRWGLSVDTFDRRGLFAYCSPGSVDPPKQVTGVIRAADVASGGAIRAAVERTLRMAERGIEAGQVRQTRRLYADLMG